ncbi:hypothetical protein [Celeribacter sp. PS-C1]|uniref:hypothetical protein n=1 Tax=Celeribacter sp. PS-C1 TaxID=2820813 RepID=UPI001CA4E38E|nr:hypothetical protein [Celeribacter sp. PS-C1]
MSVIVVPTPTPQAVPGRVPQAIPTPTPQATPQATPNLRPQPTSVATPTVMKRPKPRPNLHGQISNSGGATVQHVPTPAGQMVSQDFITQKPGSQPTHDAPRFASDNGDVWRCVASGHGKRRSYADEEASANGALVHVGAIDVLGRDLPALHPSHSNCIISVKRRSE